MLARRNLLVVMVGVVALLALVTNVVPLGQIRDQNGDLEAARQRLVDLEQETADMEARIAALHTPVEVERIARERLGYVMPGETAFVVMDTPEEQTAEEETTITDQGSALTSPWYLKVWEFMTGSDL